MKRLLFILSLAAIETAIHLVCDVLGWKLRAVQFASVALLNVMVHESCSHLCRGPLSRASKNDAVSLLERKLKAFNGGGGE